jgi:parvulin-like peptidyl-prolyl isomerase
MKRAILLVAMVLLGGATGYLVRSSPSVVRCERHLLALRFREKPGPSDAKLSQLAAEQAVDENVLQERLEILQSQFPEGEWDNALAAAGISPGAFLSRLRQHERVLAWIEQEIREQLKVESAEVAAFYEANRFLFINPVRCRARHIFFAAPNGSPLNLVEEKQKAAEAVLDRLGQGETFEAIATESEDEATKNHGGDLNFFSENRMWPEIWNALAGQKVGGPPILVKSHLGFHVIQLTEKRLSREIPFNEAAPQILGALENGKRLTAVERLRDTAGVGPRP